jgi:hypothetical protein
MTVPRESPNWHLRAIAWIFFALVSMNFGIGHSDPWSRVPGGRGIWAIVWLASLFCLFSFRSEALARRGIALFDRRIGKALVIGWIAVFALLSWKKFAGYGYEFPCIHLVLCGCAIPFLRRSWLPYVLNLGLLVASIVHFPLEYHRSDMLTSIRLSLDNWSRHLPIYFAHVTDGQVKFDWGLLPTYFPLTFFSHVPAWLLGWDLRWNTVLYRLLWMVPLYRRLSLSKENGRDALVFLILLNPYWAFRHDLYYEFYLLLLVWSWLVADWGDFFSGFATWVRDFIVLFAPFLIVRRIRERKFREILGFLTGFILAGALVYGLILPSDWTGWLNASGYFKFLADLPEFRGDYGLTAMPFLFWFHIQTFSPWIQVGGGAIFGIVAVTNRRIPELILALAAITWFLGLNVMFWNYFLISQVLWVGTGLLVSPETWKPLSER